MFLLFAICALISLVVSDVGCRIVMRCGIIVDDAESESHKSHSGRVPTGGGAAIVAGILVPLLAGVAVVRLCGEFTPNVSWLPSTIATHWGGLWLRSGDLVFLLSVGLALFVLGTIDDRYKIAWPWRLAVQILVAVTAVAGGWRATIFIDIPLVTGVVSVLWIVGLTNAFNMLDNMNGLAGGVAAIVAFFLGAVLLLVRHNNSCEPQLFLIGLLAVVFGALAGFLIHNNPFRARLFMGDGGAYFLGFLFGTITLGSSYSGYAAPQTLFAPLLILAVPLYDMISVVTIRIREGRSPFHGDQRHFSHRLVALGLSQSSAVLVIYLTTIVTAIGALLLYQLNLFGAALVLGQTVMMLLLIAILEKWYAGQSYRQSSSLTPHAENRTRRGMILFIAVIVIAALALGALTMSHRMTREYRRALQRGDEIQAAALVQSGIETIVAVVANDYESASPVAIGFDPTLSPLAAAGLTGASLLSQGVYDNETLFAGVAVAPPLPGQSPRGVGRFTVLSPRIESERLVGVRHGLVNESAKLSLLTVLRWEEATPGAGLAALLKIPSMTPRLAESLLDWLDADKTPRSAGAEVDQYTALGLSYGPRNDVPVSMDELLLVSGADREAIFGNDPERCYGYRRHGAWVSVAETLPLSFLLTVHAQEKLVTPQGEAKCFLGETDIEFLASQLRRTLDSESVDFILAYREANGATFHPLDLLGAAVVNNGKTLTSPFVLDRAEGERRFFALLDYATESSSVVVKGRVNIFEAPASVLRAIPFLTEDQVREIVARRGEVGTIREQAQRHAAWLLSQGIVDVATMRKLWDFVTCGGDVYSAQVIGFFDNTTTSARAEVVVDSTVKPPRVVFQKEMSGVRHAYPPFITHPKTWQRL